MKESVPEFDVLFSQVREALSEVTDPELDESITELGFIQKIAIGEEGNVSIEFRLPTYWCSANFAYLMASDMRDAVTALPWVMKVNIQLLDHFTATKVSEGASSGQSFEEVFPLEANENLESVRLVFRQKAFQKRQEKLLRYLIDRGSDIGILIHMPAAALLKMALDGEGDTLRRRYLDARHILGLTESPVQPAFLAIDGNPLDAATFTGYLLGLRRVRLNSEFNATICRGLLEVRYGVRQEDGLVRIEGVAASTFERERKSIRA